MSSTAPTSAPAPAASGQTQQAQASARGHGRHGSGQPADLFANLLSLLSATHDAAADSGTADTRLSSEDPATDTTSAPADGNPLAGLLGWPGAPGLLAASAGATPVPTSAGRDTVGPSGRNGLPDTGTGPAATSPRLDGATAADGPARLPEGMTLLEHPETPDADTLAALGQAGAAGGAATASGAQGPDPARPYTPVRVTAWRSTTGWSGQHPAAAAAPSASAASATTVAARAGQDFSVAAPAVTARSTITLDERFAPTGGTERDSATGAVERSPGHTGRDGGPVLPDAGASLAGGSAGQDGGTDPQNQNPASAAPGDDPTAAGAAADSEDAASGHWGAQHLRHASLRVGEAGEQAIDIQLSMAGQEVRVDIRTDDAQARASLAQDGGASLSDLLQRSGIQLGGLSVGGQAPGQGGQGQPQAPQTTATSGQPRATAADTGSERPASPPRPRADGSRPLDLFV